jgi:hypothetical protein
MNAPVMRDTVSAAVCAYVHRSSLISFCSPPHSQACGGTEADLPFHRGGEWIPGVTVNPVPYRSMQIRVMNLATTVERE